jgi:hypothetical protein
MVRFENDCVDCGKPCFSSCPYLRVAHFYCDKCGSEVDEDELYEFAGEEMCLDCIKDELPVVKAHDY